MSAKTQIETEIRLAYAFLRERNNTIPSETLQFMLDASLEKLQGQKLLIADVVCSCCENPDKRYGKFEIILADKQGTDVDVAVDYCENCGHVYNLEEY